MQPMLQKKVRFSILPCAMLLFASCEQQTQQTTVTESAATRTTAPEMVIAATTPLPAVPSSVTAQAQGFDSILVRWVDNATNESSYQIQVTTDGATYTTLSNALAANTTSYTYKLTSTVIKKYTFVVRSVNSAGASAWVKSNALTTSLIVPPAAPAGVTASVNAATGVVSIAWPDTSTNETSYAIRFTTDGTNFTTLSDDLPAGTTSYVHTPAPATSMKYTYSVRASNEAGSSDWVSSAGVTVVVIPAAPTGVTATVDAAASTISIHWSDNATNETGYQIRYTTDGSNYVTLNDSLAANTTSYTHKLTSTSTLKYTYIVRAVNAAGASGWSRSNGVSASAAVTPLLPGPNDPYVIDENTNTITVNPIGDYTTTLNTMLNRLISRTDKETHWSLRLMPGTYNIATTLRADYLVNADITSVDQAKPASLVKASYAEYMMTCRHCDNVRLSYLNWTGKMNEWPIPADKDKLHSHWGDQGLWLGSAHNSKVDHSKFMNIGNAAIRASTEPEDPTPGVNSEYVTIEDNVFENVWQVTTTADNTVTHGGVRHYTFQRNRMRDLRGSIKYCSRTAGAYDGKIIDNIWESSSDVAIELCSVNQVLISGNSFNNIHTFIMNAYTNGRKLDDGRYVAGFPWGDDITISDNVATNVGDGLRFSFDPYVDGYVPTGHRIKIDNNQITTVNNGATTAALFRVINGVADGVAITNNKLNQVANHRYWSFWSGTTGISISGNMVDGVSYNSP